VLAVDTNVLVRLFVNDESKQHQAVKAFFANLDDSEQVYVSLVVVTELVWVLESAFALDKGIIAKILETLLESGQASFQNSIAVYYAVQSYKQGADFADALIAALAKDAGCPKTLTFDKGAVKKAGMALLETL